MRIIFLLAIFSVFWVKNANAYLFFNEIAHDLVVEVLDGGPLDTLSHVLFLFGFESQLNEVLLQLLVHKVDAELFESVSLQRRRKKYIKKNISKKCCFWGEGRE